MIEPDEHGYLWIPVLPADFAAQTNGLSESKVEEARAIYRREFNSAIAQFRRWIRRDRDKSLNKTAKEITYYLLDCLNFDTGRCDPSYQTIADEVDCSVRTVERLVPKIAKSGWFDVKRRGKTCTNYYVFRVASSKVSFIDEAADAKRDYRKEEWMKRKEFRRHAQSEPTEMAGHSDSEPTTERSHEPTEMAGHEPTPVTGKLNKGTYEGELAKFNNHRFDKEASNTAFEIPSSIETCQQIIDDVAGHLPDQIQKFLIHRLANGILVPEFLSSRLEAQEKKQFEREAG